MCAASRARAFVSREGKEDAGGMRQACRVPGGAWPVRRMSSAFPLHEGKGAAACRRIRDKPAPCEQRAPQARHAHGAQQSRRAREKHLSDGKRHAPAPFTRMSRAMHSSGRTCAFHRTDPERNPKAFQLVFIRIPSKIQMPSRIHVPRPENPDALPSSAPCVLKSHRTPFPAPCLAPSHPEKSRPGLRHRDARTLAHARHHRTHALTSATFRLWCFLLSDYGSLYF